MKPIVYFLLGMLVLAQPLNAQLDERHIQSPACRLPPAPFDGYLYVPPPVDPARVQARLTSAVNVNFLPAGQEVFDYTCGAWPADAQAAMNYAAAIWGSLLNTPFTITVDACWSTDMASGILGSAGAATNYLLTDGTNTTWYPVALSELLLGNEALQSTEVRAVFNAGLSDWYFGTDGNVPWNEVDFVTVALHELGHGLGFAGFEEIDDGNGEAECEGIAGEGCYGAEAGGEWYPDIYTRQLELDNGNSLTDLANPSPIIAGLLTGGSNSLFLSGPSLLANNGNSPAMIYTPSTYAPGSTYSHFDLNTFGNELMKPQLDYGEAIHNPGLALNLLEDLGWPVNAAALPVTWVFFEAQEGREAIILRWETGSEQNNAGFEVQRSRDGISWETLGFMPGRGEAAVYKYEDQWPYAGLNYYRLRQLDYDGSADFSRMEAAYFDSGKQANIGFFPNPVQERMTIAYAGFSEPIPFNVTDMLGKVLFQGILRSPREELSLEGLPAGAYWLKVGKELPLTIVKL
ncbi:MAG: T9SS type A sorting domain-containing protein [Phaeodactylibacter sp.]|nr:T9SS type A sorting domain-containing protein [Phaeodactylibacter sp.]